MDKNTVIGLLLIVAVLVGFGYYNSTFQPQNPSQAVVQRTANQEVSNVAERKDARKEALVTVDSTALFYKQLSVTDTASHDYVVLKNNNVIVEINPRGGTIGNVYLRNYTSYDDFHEGKKIPLHLYDGQNASLNFSFNTSTGVLNTSDYIFETVDQKDSTQVTMRLATGNGTKLDLRYCLLSGDKYMMNVEVVTFGMGKYATTQTKNLAIDWSQKIKQHEKGYDFENRYSSLTYKLTGDDTQMLSEIQDDSETAEGPVDWVAFKSQYFSTVLIAPVSEFQGLSARSRQIPKEAKNNDAGFLKDYNVKMEIPFDVTGTKATQLQFFFGPNSFNLLKSMDADKVGEKDLDLEDLVYLGWPLFKWINRFFTIYVFDFLTWLGLPMGIVLLLITILMRIIVYMPTRKSFLSSAKMRVLKPKVDEISKKYPRKEDAMKKQQEMMSLYSQYGVSPMGGCLPMLIQMPLWIAMFNFVPNAIELRQEGFLWADDLSTYDSIWDFGFHIWGIGDHLSLFCLLFCVTNLVYSHMSIRQQRDSMSAEQAQQMKMMQWMMYLMPVMFFFMFNTYSAGLNYYYFISLLASALTMWYLRRTTDDAKLLAKLEANYQANKNNPNKKPKGLAARLEALQKAQEAQMEARRNRQK